MLAALLILLAGCAEKTQGNPVAGDDTNGQTTTTEQSTDDPSTSESTPDGAADIDPCSLIGSGDISSLGLTEQQEKTIGDAKVCQWHHDGASLEESFSVSLKVFDSVGLADIAGTDIQSLPNIGSHEAKSYTGTTGGCGVSLGLTDTSRVDATATGGSNQQAACQIATQLATAAEPNLP